MLSLVLAVIIPVAYASAATNRNSTADCNFDPYTGLNQHPNASTAYSIPAVVSVGSTLNNSTTKTWQITNSIWQVSVPSDRLYPQGEALSLYGFLDTSSTINASSGSSLLPLAGCSFVFAKSYAKASSDGSCGKIFGQSCLNEIMQVAQTATASILSVVESSTSTDLCSTISDSVNNYITSSSTVCDKDGPSIGLNLGLNFSNRSIDNCTNPPTPSPILLYGREEPFQQGNATTYDYWAETATPILLALFSNNSAVKGAAGNFAQTYLTCTSPMNVTAGSHAPTSAAGRSAVAVVKSVVSFALAVNALVFLNS